MAGTKTAAKAKCVTSVHWDTLGTMGRTPDAIHVRKEERVVLAINVPVVHIEVPETILKNVWHVLRGGRKMEWEAVRAIVAFLASTMTKKVKPRAKSAPLGFTKTSPPKKNARVVNLARINPNKNKLLAWNVYQGNFKTLLGNNPARNVPKIS